MRSKIAGLMVAAVLCLSACGMDWPGPCDGAPTPSSQDLDAAANGYEVEWGDCELDTNGNWVYDD